jgi:hypothetical protein
MTIGIITVCCICLYTCRPTGGASLRFDVSRYAWQFPDITAAHSDKAFLPAAVGDLRACLPPASCPELVILKPSPHLPPVGAQATEQVRSIARVKPSRIALLVAAD